LLKHFLSHSFSLLSTLFPFGGLRINGSYSGQVLQSFK
jgi:hypothetical protein